MKSFEEFCSSVSYKDDPQQTLSQNTTYSSTIVDSPRIRTGKVHFVSDSGIVPCFLRAESTLLKGRLDIFGNESRQVLICSFRLGSGGNLIVTVSDEKIALEDENLSFFLICHDHQEAVEWANFLCSSAFATSPLIKRSVRVPSIAKPSSRSSPNTTSRNISTSKPFAAKTVVIKIDDASEQSSQQALVPVNVEQTFNRGRNETNTKLLKSDNYEEIMHRYNDKKVECEMIKKKIAIESSRRDETQKQLSASISRAQNLTEERFSVLAQLHLQQEDLITKKFEGKRRQLQTNGDFLVLDAAQQKKHLEIIRRAEDAAMQDFRKQCSIEDQQLFAKVQIEIAEGEIEVERLSAIVSRSEQRLEALDHFQKEAEKAVVNLKRDAKIAKGSQHKIIASQPATVQSSALTASKAADSSESLAAQTSRDAAKESSKMSNRRAKKAILGGNKESGIFKSDSSSTESSDPSKLLPYFPSGGTSSATKQIVENFAAGTANDEKSEAEAILRHSAPELWKQQNGLKDKLKQIKGDKIKGDSPKEIVKPTQKEPGRKVLDRKPRPPQQPQITPSPKTRTALGVKQNQKNVDDIIQFSYRVFLLQQRSCAGIIQRAWRRKRLIRQVEEQRRLEAEENQRLAEEVAAKAAEEIRLRERMLMQCRAAIMLQCLIRRRRAKAIYKEKIKDAITALEGRASRLRETCILRWIARYRVRQREKEIELEVAIGVLLHKVLKKRKKRIKAVAKRIELISHQPLVPAVSVELKPVQKVPFIQGGHAPKNITDRLMEVAQREIEERQSLGALAPVAKSLKKTSKTVGRLLNSALMVEPQTNSPPYRRAIDGASLREQELMKDHSQSFYAGFSEDSLMNQQLRRVAVENFVTLQQRDLAVAAALRR